MISRQRLDEISTHIAKSLDAALPVMLGTTERVGFMVFLFEFGSGGYLAYVSNGDREKMIKAVEEWLDRMKAGLTTDPPGPRANG